MDGSTVKVQLHVFAGIDVQVTLDGKDPEQVNALIPKLEFVFENVAAGIHTIRVRDVVGFEQAAEVVLPTLGIPEWLTDLIQQLENEPVANPPASITQSEYKAQIVYFLPQRCCDIFSDLYDADGNVMGHPDGGITGQGDGRAPEFFEERSNERIIWRDQRTYDASLIQLQAPIESVEILVMESLPPQYGMVVASGLPNGCVSFAGYRLDSNGDDIRVEIVNWKPADPEIACPATYEKVFTRVPLGTNFESGRTYTVVVNDVFKDFAAQ